VERNAGAFRVCHIRHVYNDDIEGANAKQEGKTELNINNSEIYA
jgi:hypothetical protein